MAVKITIRCNGCFTRMRAASMDDFPDDCPTCGAVLMDRTKPEVAAPFIGLSARTRSIDRVYNDAVAASERRIEQAVAMTPGSSKEDFAHLKITDYRSGHEGEPAVAMPQPSQVFQQNIAALQSGGVQTSGAGIVDISGQTQAFSHATRIGDTPNAGIRALDRLRGVHRGNIDPRMNTPISSLPALETQSPTYVPRGVPITPGVG